MDNIENIKSVSCEFAIWLQQNTIPSFRSNVVELLDFAPDSYENIEMTIEDAFDYFMHEIKTEKELKDLNIHLEK